jgi:hypothetical protein
MPCSVVVGVVHQAGAPVLAAHRLVDPQVADLHPASPDRAHQAAQGFAPPVLHKKVHRVEVRHPGHADVEHIEAVAHQAAGVARLLQKHDF